MQKQNNIDYSVKVLELKDLRQHFKVGIGKRKIIVKAVDGISFDIYKRESLGLVGESGCGKTTTGRTIIKLYEPTGGTVHLNGVRVGAGTGSNVYRIKQAKKQAKLEKIEADDLKLEIYKRKQELKSNVIVEETKMSEIDAELTNHLHDLHQPIDDYKNKEDAITSKRLAVLGDLEFAHKNKLRTIRRSEAEVIARRAKYDLYAVESKAQKKLKGISDSKALSREDRVARKAELNAEVEAKKAEIISKRDADIAKIESKLLTKAEIKTKVAEENARYKEQVTAAKKDFNAQFERLAETKPDMARYKANVAEARAKAEEKKQKHKATIAELKAKAKADIADIKAKAKEKPELYSVDQDTIDRVNRDLKEKVTKEKIEIKEIKSARKSKEVTDALNKMQMIFQDPVESLNPRMTVKEIIAEGLRIQGVKDDELINEKVFEVLKIVGLVPEHAFRYPHEFSGGQRQRIGIARALIVNPDFIIADEPISALDVSIQAQVINLMNELKENLGLTILFIAHDLSVVKYFCDRIAVMYMGKIVELASSEELFKNPLHPYTKSLLSAIPQPDPISEKKRVRFPYDPRMHDYAFDKPNLREIKPGHFIYANTSEYANYQKELSGPKEVVK